jgi:hypothetical protein
MMKQKKVEKRTITLLVNARLYEKFQKFCYKQGFSVSGRFNYLMNQEMERKTCWEETKRLRKL